MPLSFYRQHWQILLVRSCPHISSSEVSGANLSTGGSKIYLPFNGFCTPNLEAKDESSANLIRIVMQALFTPPWRHSQGENWLSKLCKSRSVASMGGTETVRTTLLLLYSYKWKKPIDRPKFFSLLEHDHFSQVLLLKISHNCPAVITLTQFWQCARKLSHTQELFWHHELGSSNTQR